MNLSVNKLWNDVKIAVEPQEVKDFVIEEQCIANELLLVLYSEDLDSMARAYAKRMKIKQDNTKH